LVICLMLRTAAIHTDVKSRFEKGRTFVPSAAQQR
jgi:hypothetical protein